MRISSSSPVSKRGLYVVCAAVITVPLLALCVAVAIRPHTSDFMCFWTGARFVLDGRDPYDAVAWSRAMTGEYVDAFGQVRGTFCPGRYGYPLTTAIAMLPLGVLPIEIAAPIWEGLLILGAVLGTVLIWRSLDGPQAWVPYLLLLVLGSQPLWNTAMNAQFGGLLLGVVGVTSYLIRRDRLGPAGATAVLLLLKPHIFAPLVFATWSRRTIRLIAVFILSATLLVAVSLAVQPAWPVAWLRELFGNRIDMTSVATSTWTLASWLPGGRPLALLVIAVVSVSALELARRRAVNAVEAMAVLACLTLVAAPYTGSHDQLLLVPAWLVVLRHALARGSRGMLAALPLVVLVAPWLLYAIRDVTGGNEIPSALMPVIASALVLVTLFSRESPAPSPSPAAASSIPIRGR